MSVQSLLLIKFGQVEQIFVQSKVFVSIVENKLSKFLRFIVSLIPLQVLL